MPNYRGRRKGTRRIQIWAKGKQHEWIVEGTKADGDSFEARKRIELDADRLSKRAAPKFSDFCAQKYTPYAETNLKESTWKDSRIYQVATLVEFFGELKLTEITNEQIELYKEARKKKKRRPSSINNELRVLTTILNWATAAGYPAGERKVRKLSARGSGRVRVWSLSELQKLFAAARKLYPHMLRMLVFLANTGCRRGEALAAEWSWIDFDAGMIRIPSNPHWQPKSGKPREVPMSDACRAILAGERKHERWVFPNRHRTQYEEFPKDSYRQIRVEAGLVGGVHTLRHTFASMFLQRVPDLFLLSQVLGHSQQRVTELYTHLLPEHLARAKNAVNVAPTLALTTAEPDPTQTKQQKTSATVKTRP